MTLRPYFINVRFVFFQSNEEQISVPMRMLAPDLLMGRVIGKFFRIFMNFICFDYNYVCSLIILLMIILISFELHHLFEVKNVGNLHQHACAILGCYTCAIKGRTFLLRILKISRTLRCVFPVVFQKSFSLLCHINVHQVWHKSKRPGHTRDVTYLPFYLREQWKTWTAYVFK